MRILTFKKVYLIHGKQRLEWLWVFQPWFGKNKTVIGTFWTSEHLRGHWKCSKVFLSIQNKKKDLRQWKETESSTPFVVKASTSLFLNSLKFTLKALTFFCRETRGFKNFETGIWVHLQTMPAGLMSRSIADEIWQRMQKSRQKFVMTQFVLWFCQENSGFVC